MMGLIEIGLPGQISQRKAATPASVAEYIPLTHTREEYGTIECGPVVYPADERYWNYMDAQLLTGWVIDDLGWTVESHPDARVTVEWAGHKYVARAFDGEGNTETTDGRWDTPTNHRAIDESTELIEGIWPKIEPLADYSHIGIGDAIPLPDGASTVDRVDDGDPHYHWNADRDWWCATELAEEQIKDGSITLAGYTWPDVDAPGAGNAPLPIWEWDWDMLRREKERLDAPDDVDAELADLDAADPTEDESIPAPPDDGEHVHFADRYWRLTDRMKRIYEIRAGEQVGCDTEWDGSTLVLIDPDTRMPIQQYTPETAFESEKDDAVCWSFLVWGGAATPADVPAGVRPAFNSIEEWDGMIENAEGDDDHR